MGIIICGKATEVSRRDFFPGTERNPHSILDDHKYSESEDRDPRLWIVGNDIGKRIHGAMEKHGHLYGSSRAIVKPRDDDRERYQGNHSKQYLLHKREAHRAVVVNRTVPDRPGKPHE